MVLSPIPDELVELIARRFPLLAEPMRIRLFDRLRDGEATVHQLADELGTSEQNVSKHLTLWPRRASSPGERKVTASTTGSPTGGVRALRAGLWVGGAAPAGARRAGAGPVGRDPKGAFDD